MFGGITCTYICITLHYLHLYLLILLNDFNRNVLLTLSEKKLKLSLENPSKKWYLVKVDIP